jgi:exodeoxyribonuclease-3
MIKVYSWNVNGIRAVLKKGMWQPFLDQEKPDIICLQEIKANAEQFDLELNGIPVQLS